MRLAGALVIVLAQLSAMPTGAGANKSAIDSVQLVSVTPVTGTYLQRGQPIRIDVELQYTLNSRKSAVLSLSLAQFRNPDSCGFDPGELVEADEVTVQRGSGTLHMPITWPGDTGLRTKGRVFGYGSLSFTAMMWKSHLKDRFYLESFRDSVCLHF